MSQYLVSHKQSKKPKLRIMIGMPGSGKTTSAEKLVTSGMYDVVHELDQSRIDYAGTKTRYWQLANESETSAYPNVYSLLSAYVWKDHYGRIEKDLKKGKNVIVANTSFDPKRRQELYDIAFKYSAEIWLDVVGRDLSIDELQQRNQLRSADDRLPPNKLADMYRVEFAKNWERIEQEAEVFNYRVDKDALKKQFPNAKPTIVFDIDGTLAHNTFRSPFDYAKLHTDTPLEEQCSLALFYAQMRDTYDLEFWTGREYGPEKNTGKDTQYSSAGTQFYTKESTKSFDHWIDTHTWLCKNVSQDIELGHIKMRQHGDNRTAYIVKHEMLRRAINNGQHVTAIFDDNSGVCQAFANSGVLTYQVK